VREVSDPLTSLVKKIDRRMNEAAGKYSAGRNLGTFFIIGEAAGRAEQLQSLARKEGLQHISFCIGTVPANYELNNDAEVTVVIYNPARRGQQTVQANFALKKGELDETKCDAIVEALSRVLPK
jgi:hypothetical protein